MREVKKRSGWIGVAHDGDADRLVLIDEEGSKVGGDEVLAMAALDALERGKLTGNAVVVTVMSNLGLDEALTARGGRVVRTPVGDRYVSEAKFVVRAPSTAALGQIANVLQGSGIVKSADDAYVVHGYLESRDALLELSKNSGLEEMFGRPEADILSRYPKFYRKANVEDLYKHYLKFVYLDYNQTTGISLLRVQAFRPKDAHDLAAAMLDNAEVLINRLNERAQQDAVVWAGDDGIPQLLCLR
jgi:hypothetical protein